MRVRVVVAVVVMVVVVVGSVEEGGGCVRPYELPRERVWKDLVSVLPLASAHDTQQRHVVTDLNDGDHQAVPLQSNVLSDVSS